MKKTGPEKKSGQSKSRAPNCRPFKQLKVNNDIFHPRTVVLWNNISLSSSNIVNIDIFRSNALSFIRSV